MTKYHLPQRSFTDDEDWSNSALSCALEDPGTSDYLWETIEILVYAKKIKAELIRGLKRIAFLC